VESGCGLRREADPEAVDARGLLLGLGGVRGERPTGADGMLDEDGARRDVVVLNFVGGVQARLARLDHGAAMDDDAGNALRITLRFEVHAEAEIGGMIVRFAFLPPHACHAAMSDRYG